MTACVFCSIVAGHEPATIHEDWDDAIAIEPLNPVTDGHALIIPKVHVIDAAIDPRITGMVMERAASFGRWWRSFNLITSVGEEATQTIRHLHVHFVPRRDGDGLALPWSAS